MTEKERRKKNIISLIVFCLKTFSTQSNRVNEWSVVATQQNMFTTKSKIFYIFMCVFIFHNINNIILSENSSVGSHFIQILKWRWRWCIPFFRDLFYTHEDTVQNYKKNVVVFSSFLQYVLTANIIIENNTRKSYKKKDVKRPSFQSQTSKSNFTNRLWCGPGVR